MPAALPDKPYNKRDDEGSKAYHAFKIYLELGPERSLEKVRRALEKDSNYSRRLETWSSKYQWQERIKAFEGEQSKMELDEMMKQNVQAKLRRLRQYQRLQEKGMQRVEDIPMEEIPARVALDYVEIGSKGERIELSEPGDITENRNSEATNINIVNNAAILNINKDSLDMSPMDVYTILGYVDAEKQKQYLDLIMEARAKWDELHRQEGDTHGNA